jgi:hypothetical protein
VELFLLGLVVHFLFRITPITLSGACALYLLNLAYTSLTGTYYFVDAGISVSLFLGLHFLITDPATSPKTTAGKWLFGGLYGAGAFGAYAFLVWLGLPQFYDKLLPVPLLNLSVRWIDRVAGSLAQAGNSPGTAEVIRLKRVNLAHMAIWSTLFAVMISTGYLSHQHPGASPEFWERACESRVIRACTVWSYELRVTCEKGSARSCLTWGTALELGRLLPRTRVVAGEALTRSCELGLEAGCVRLGEFWSNGGREVLEDRCNLGDAISCATAAQVYATGATGMFNSSQALRFLETACNDKWPPACYRMGQEYLEGQWLPADTGHALRYLKASCEGGYAKGCANMATLGLEGNAQTWRRRACFLGDESSCRHGENPN